MNKLKLRIINNSGMTLVELIITMAVLGILIAPVMTMYAFSAKINMEAANEYKSAMLAQSYMEEIKAMEELDTQKYEYDSGTGKYEFIVPETEGSYGAEITIAGEGIVYSINISIIQGGNVIRKLEGSKIFLHCQFSENEYEQ
jgi:prepilin-type N-terminal cleavage/methylation domain-containing protein